MATDEELYKIVVQVQGQADVERLTAAIQKEQDAIRLLTAELRLTAIGQAEFDAKSKAAAASIAQMQSQITALNGKMGGIGKWGNAIGQVGYAVDDLQYGFKGIANNIQPILTSIPGLAAIAGPISIAAIAAYQLYEHWDDLAALFGQGHVKTQAEDMEDLRKKTELTANEAERLKRAQNLQTTVKDLQQGQSKESRETGGKVKEAVNEVGFANVINGLQANAPGLVNDQGEALDARLKLEDFLYGGLGLAHKPGTGVEFNKSQNEPQVIAEKARLEKELADARDRTAQGKVAQAINVGDWGKVPLNQLIEAVEKNPAAFAGGNFAKGREFLKSLKESDPMVEAQKEDEEYRLRTNMEQEARMEKFRLGDQAIEDERARSFAANASPAARKLALSDLAIGAPIDKADLARQFASDIKGTGTVKDDQVQGLATKAAEDLAESLKKTMTEEANKGGMTAQTAAQAGLVELDKSEAQKRVDVLRTELAAMKTEQVQAKTMGSAEFAKSLLTIQPKSLEDLAKQQLQEAEKAVAKLEEVRLQLVNGIQARIGRGNGR